MTRQQCAVRTEPRPPPNDQALDFGQDPRRPYDLLRMAGLALAARGFEAMGEDLLRIGIELVEGDVRDIETAPWPPSPN